jgi:ribosomal protein S18 acetylase RimI-like enzyme
MTLTLQPAQPDTLLALMSQFQNAGQLQQWGGEGFMYPPRRPQFLSRLLLPDTQSYELVNPAGKLIGFGQLCDRFSCHHLARLLIVPAERGQGYASILIKQLIAAGLREDKHKAVSLYVFATNQRALNCYQKLGFQPARQPAEPRADLLFMQLTNQAAHALIQHGY